MNFSKIYFRFRSSLYPLPILFVLMFSCNQKGETDTESIDQCINKVLLTLETLGYIPKAEGGGGPCCCGDDEEKVKERLRGLGYIE